MSDDRPALGAERAERLDAEDPLAAFRSRFHLPRREDGEPLRYFAGHSLGLQPRAVADVVRSELDAWARDAVDGHFKADAPWVSYHELVRESCARLVGAHADEVVAMNSLTVNLHLMMVSFFRPTSSRYKILMEDSAFPSDTYAVKTQLVHHGLDPNEARIVARSRHGAPTASSEEVLETIERHGDEIALVLLGGVNYFTGELFDLARIAACARERGAVVGLDLAHAAGNVPLALHDWDVDFAVWCTYKYINAGPGAVAACFVHRRHASNTNLSRFGGWWGNDPDTRFRMHLESEFRPRASADGWQLSNPPILALAPLRVSLALFDEAGMAALRRKSLLLTGYLEAWVAQAAGQGIELLTPRDPARRGCQLSLRAVDRARERFAALRAAGIVADYREPDVIRLAPVPLYNSFADVRAVGQALCGWSGVE